jgi:hypothetical protein
MGSGSELLTTRERYPDELKKLIAMGSGLALPA